MNKVTYGLFLVVFGISGCNVDLKGMCENNDDCVEGYLCKEKKCIALNPISIVTEKLENGVVGAQYNATLEAANGIPPYRWSLENQPVWMSIDEKTGKISGIPTEVAIPVNVTTVVTDSTTGRDSNDEKKYQFDIHICSTGQDSACSEPIEGKCMLGVKQCTDGEWGACEVGKTSDVIEQCGADCQRCDDKADICVDGVCSCAGIELCMEGMQCCLGKCIDPKQNTQNCGQCDHNCTVLMQNTSNPHCFEGVCRHDGCLNHYLDCNADSQDGCEAGLSAQHCGSCDDFVDCTIDLSHVNEPMCRLDGQEYICDYDGEGSQGVGCESGWLDCNQDRSDGCELASSIDNCASCGDNCNIQVKNANNILCNMGVCDFESCNDGFGNCDTIRGNGCETDLLTKTSNCGDCQTDCNSQVENTNAVFCNSGSCDYSICDADYGDCDGSRANGCEVNLLTTATKCGGCGNNCSSVVKNADGVFCNGGKCDYNTCKNNYGDCDTNRTNGCETNLLSNYNHCGACNKKCSVQNCQNGVCCECIDTQTESCSECKERICDGCSYGKCQFKPGADCEFSQRCVKADGSRGVYECVDCRLGSECI